MIFLMIIYTQKKCKRRISDCTEKPERCSIFSIMRYQFGNYAT